MDSPDICDLLADAAIDGYKSFIRKNPNGDPMEAFNAAGEFINDAMESEFTPHIYFINKNKCTR